ncbi:MAG: hypothetical protein LUE29_07440 [Lachnospiraceae bacterium]|nr:hypothetical protein [Lachnospiraceae bacterium]
MIADRYYYMQLSESDRKVYQALYKGVLNLKREIRLDGVCLPMESVHAVFRAVTNDNPFLYYFNQSLLEVRQSEYETILEPQYFCTREQIKIYNSRIEAIVNQMMSELCLAECSEPERLRRVHDYFCENFEYDTESLGTGNYNRQIAAHSIIGVFAKGRAVCEGISKAVKLVLNTAGIKCIVVDGLGGTEEGEHSWNIIKINGKPYHLDMTWDLANSKEGRTNYDYYNLTDADISRDHSNFAGVPNCISTEENYFVKNHLEFYDQTQLYEYIRYGLSRAQKDYYFRYREKESIEQIVYDVVHYLQAELPRQGFCGTLRSSMKKSQGTGRVTVV